MKKHKYLKRLILILVLFVFLIMILMFCFWWRHSEKELEKERNDYHEKVLASFIEGFTEKSRKLERHAAKLPLHNSQYDGSKN